jgi:protein phosphatase
MIQFAAATDTGSVRSENQDRWLGDAELGLFAVADGLGGHAAGALAAQLAVDLLPRLVRRALSLAAPDAAEQVPRAVADEVKTLSQLVYQETRGQPAVNGTGTTLVLALVDGRHATIVHVGDSRAYLLREGKMRQLTGDHSLARRLIDNRTLPEAEVRRHPAARKLTQYIGMPPPIAPDAQRIAFLPGDLLLLSSDGLHGQVDDGGIAEILRAGGTVQGMGEKLVAASNRAGGRDNVTVVLISQTE